MGKLKIRNKDITDNMKLQVRNVSLSKWKFGADTTKQRQTNYEIIRELLEKCGVTNIRIKDVEEAAEWLAVYYDEKIPVQPLLFKTKVKEVEFLYKGETLKLSEMKQKMQATFYQLLNNIGKGEGKSCKGLKGRKTLNTPYKDLKIPKDVEHFSRFKAGATFFFKREYDGKVTIVAEGRHVSATEYSLNWVKQPDNYFEGCKDVKF